MFTCIHDTERNNVTCLAKIKEIYVKKVEDTKRTSANSKSDSKNFRVHKVSIYKTYNTRSSKDHNKIVEMVFKIVVFSLKQLP